MYALPEVILSMIDSGDTYYAVLGISETATLEEIRSAYRTLLKKIHPDTVATLSLELRRQAADATQEIIEAYSVLADSIQRDRYDHYLATERQKSTASLDPHIQTASPTFRVQSIPACEGRASNIRRLGKTTGSRKEDLAIPTLTVLILGVFLPFLIWIVTVDGNNSILGFAGVEFTLVLSQMWLGGSIYRKISRREGATVWVSGILISILLNAFYTIVALVLFASLPGLDSQETGRRLLHRTQRQLATTVPKGHALRLDQPASLTPYKAV